MISGLPELPRVAVRRDGRRFMLVHRSPLNGETVIGDRLIQCTDRQRQEGRRELPPQQTTGLSLEEATASMKLWQDHLDWQDKVKGKKR